MNSENSWGAIGYEKNESDVLGCQNNYNIFFLQSTNKTTRQSWDYYKYSYILYKKSIKKRNIFICIKTKVFLSLLASIN